jgi:hypothetical protein
MTSRSGHSPVWSSVAVWLLCACFAYLHIRPVGHNPVLLSVLAIMALVAVATVAWRRRRAATPVLVAIGATLVFGILGTSLGMGNPGVLNGALVWIVAPVLYGLWVLAGDERLVRSLFTVSAASTTLISVGILLYIGGKLGLIPQLVPPIIQDWGGFSFDTLGINSTAISFYGLSTLVGAAPLWLTASILPRHRLLPHRALALVAAITATLATMVSGRAALTVVTLVVPAAVWVVWRAVTRVEPRGRLRAAVPFVVFGGVAALIGLLAAMGNTNVINAFGRVLSLVTGDGQTESDQIRDTQAMRLLEEWSTSPILGHGFGATIADYSRSPDRPWDFELQYHLILMQVGLLGAGIVAVALVAAAYGVVIAMRRHPDMTTVLLVASAAAIAMGVANASNPYLQAPGHMWAVYLVLMVVNVTLMDQTESADEVPTNNADAKP